LSGGKSTIKIIGEDSGIGIRIGSVGDSFGFESGGEICWESSVEGPLRRAIQEHPLATERAGHIRQAIQAIVAVVAGHIDGDQCLKAVNVEEMRHRPTPCLVYASLSIVLRFLM
jgi:hypothetical protein